MSVRFNVRIQSKLSWAHIPVINWAVSLDSRLEVSEKEEGVVALPLRIGP